MYTARELIEELQKLPPDTKIILQKDVEGNGYSELRCTGLGWYEPDLFFDESWNADDCCLMTAEWEAMQKRPKDFVLSP